MVNAICDHFFTCDVVGGWQKPQTISNRSKPQGSKLVPTMLTNLTMFNIINVGVLIE